jgi:hypothetical protein
MKHELITLSQQRTYSEDEEVDLSATSMTSVTSVGSADSDGSREFMDVLQVCWAHDLSPAVSLTCARMPSQGQQDKLQASQHVQLPRKC